MDHSRKTKAELILELEALQQRVAELEMQRPPAARKHEEEEWRENEANFHAFLNTIDHLLFVLDMQGNILWMNDTVTQRLHYTAQELLGQSMLLVHPPERRAEADRIFVAILAGQADYCPVPVMTRDGRQIPVETRMLKGRWSGQDVIFGITKDLSAVKASEEKFAVAFQANPALMAISEIETGRYVEVNNVFLRTLGYTRAEVIGHTPADLNLFVNPEQRAAAVQVMQQQGRLRDLEVAVRTKGGAVRHGLFAAEYIQLQDRPLLLTLMNDITESHLMAAALQDSERRYRQMFAEHTAILLLIDSESGAIVEANPAASAFYGYPLEVLQQMNIDQINTLPPEEVKRKRLAARARRSNYFIFKHRLASGEVRDVEVHSVPLEIKDQRLLYSIIHDITDRRQAEAAEREQRALAEALRDTAIALSAAHDLDQIWQVVLAQAGRIAPYDAIHLTMLDDDGRARVAYQQGYTERMSETVRSATGPDRPASHPAEKTWIQSDMLHYSAWARARASAPLKVQECIIGFIHLDSAIPECYTPAHLERLQAFTDQIALAIENAQLYATIRAHEAELETRVADRTRELMEANARQVELSQLKYQFIDRISHELRTPLAAMKLHFDLLLQDRPEKREIYLQIVREKLAELQQKIEDLLAVSRLSQEKFELNCEPISVNSLLHELLTDRAAVAVKRNLALHTAFAAALPPVLADRALLWQALMNVLINALNYTPPGGLIELGTVLHVNEAGSWVTIAIRDTGPGISDLDLAHIFEPFYRGAAARNYKTPGTGVGLFIARRAVEKLDGHLIVESQLGQGSTFMIWLKAA